jgi:hypothetical protein
MYCSAHIRQLLYHLLEDKFDEDYWKRHYPRNRSIDEARCQSRAANLFLIEIATVKYFLCNGEYYKNEYIRCDQHPSLYESGVLTREKLLDNIRFIYDFLQSRNKQVLFISHFNPDGIPQRELIISSLRESCVPFYDPTPLSRLPHALSDPNHYYHEVEPRIMENLDKTTRPVMDFK